MVSKSKRRKNRKSARERARRRESSPSVLSLLESQTTTTTITILTTQSFFFFLWLYSFGLFEEERNGFKLTRRKFPLKKKKWEILLISSGRNFLRIHDKERNECDNLGRLWNVFCCVGTNKRMVEYKNKHHVGAECILNAL